MGVIKRLLRKLGLKGSSSQKLPRLKQKSTNSVRTTGAETGAPISRHAIFRAYLGAVELTSIVGQEGQNGRTLLDVGGAYGIHARYFRSCLPGLKVDVIDTHPASEPLTFCGFYSDFMPPSKYDYIWASHVLEHIPNPGDFFSKLHGDLKEGGWAAITVPPLKHDMTFAHVTLWNAGLLLIHFVNAGFDCSNARIATYGYNVTVLAQKKSRGDKSNIECLPGGIVRKGAYFEGRIERLNWQTETLPWQPDLSKPGFFQKDSQVFYRDPILQEDIRVG